MRIYERIPETGAANEYVKTLVKLVAFFRSNGACVVLMPHEIRFRGPIQDDRDICRMIKQEFEGDDHVAAMIDSYPASILKGVIQKMDFLVGSRFHSIVAALSSRIPVFAIGWSHKYGELMGSVGLGDFVLEHGNLESETINPKVQSAWNQRDRSKTKLEARIPEVVCAVDQMFDRVSDTLRQQRPSQGQP
jgi:polysaccharide pyruvyl transferase WcaK-like protein